MPLYMLVSIIISRQASYSQLYCHTIVFMHTVLLPDGALCSRGSRALSEGVHITNVKGDISGTPKSFLLLNFASIINTLLHAFVIIHLLLSEVDLVQLLVHITAAE